MPYQCIDQATWNNDYTAEVFIGRFSGETKTEISNQTFKTIEYESGASNESYYVNGLSLGEKLDNTTYGTSAMNEIEKIFTDNSTDWKFDSLYDKSGSYMGKSDAHQHDQHEQIQHHQPSRPCRL